VSSALGLLVKATAFLLISACISGVPAEPGSDSSSPVDTLEMAYELVPTDDVLIEQCQAAANLLQFSVPCPTALPATNNPVRCEIPAAFREANVEPKEGCALGGGFILEPTGIKDLELFHLVVEGTQDAARGCAMHEQGQAVQIGSRQAMLFACSEASGLHANHILVRFQEGDSYVVVSAHGHTDLNERAVLSIADGIQMVPPT
jgi:hypothetical protein